MGTGGRDGPFVGRVREVAEARAVLEAADGGSGGLLLLSGPAGIGKTRIVEVACAGRSSVVWGRCVDDPGAPALWPWRRVLRELAAVAAAVAGPLSAVDELSGGADAAAAQFLFMVTASEALVEAAAPSGLTVVLEDLHWADETSLRLLRHLATELHRSRLSVIGTHRTPSAADGGALADALPELLRLPSTRWSSLSPLSEEDVRRYLTGAGAVPDDAAALHRRSGGNPLYLRALVRAGRHPVDDDGLPELGSLVQTSLGALSASALDLVRTAAVIGEEVDPDLLAAVTGRPVAEVAADLDAAVLAGVLEPVPQVPGHRRFAHAVVRDTVHAGLAPSVREELHRRTAVALERAAGDDDLTAGVIAAHLVRASAEPADLRRAAGWAVRAAGAASRSLAFDEAARSLALALDAARRGRAGTDEQARILAELALAEYRAGRFAESLQHAGEAADAAAACGRADLLAQAALTVHDVSAPHFAPALVALCERALAEPRATQDPAVHARLLAQLASALADSGRWAVAEARAVEALRVAEDSGDPEAIVDAVRARMKVAPPRMSTTERLRLGRLGIEHSAATGQPLAALWGGRWRIDAALELGDLAMAEEELAGVTALARRTRLPLVRWHEARLRAARAELLGDFPEALEHNERARAVAEAELPQDPLAAAMSWLFLQQHALTTGEVCPVDPRALGVLDRFQRVPVVAVSLAVAALHEDGEQARARYEALLPRLRTTEVLTSFGVAATVVPLVEEHADGETAERLLGLLPASRQPAVAAGIYLRGTSTGLRGRLALVLRRPDEAVSHLYDALDADLRLGAGPSAVHDRLGLATALLDRGAPGDPAHAADHARAAGREARSLGMPGPRDRAAQLIDRAARAARVADPLSAREREVSDLVAQALTNRQIAERLFVSERTVETHVRNVLAKLGLANRTQIATTRLGRTDH